MDDKRLRREIGVIQEHLQTGELSAVKWISGSIQLADVLTKHGVFKYKLSQVMQEGKLDLNVYNCEL